MEHVRTMFLFCFLLMVAVSQYKVGALQLVAENDAQGAAGGKRFDQVMGVNGAIKVMGDSINFIWGVLYRDGSVPKPTKIKIELYVDDKPPMFKAAAYTIGQDGAYPEIHLDEGYVGSIQGDVVREITRILYHEMTHAWQWDGGAPRGLIEGFADYITLIAGLAPSSQWGKPGEGDKWDQGYQVTAYFLQYCEGLKSGFAAALNAKMSSGWNENFFNQLLGQSVQQLWASYKEKYGSS